MRADTNFVELLDANPWLKTTKLVVKPDMLFGKRGKHDLVGLNLDFAGVEAFIKARMGKVTFPQLPGPPGPHSCHSRATRGQVCLQVPPIADAITSQ